MAQSEAIIIDTGPARRLVKQAIRALEEANRELARVEERVTALETRIANDYGIGVIHE